MLKEARKQYQNRYNQRIKTQRLPVQESYKTHNRRTEINIENPQIVRGHGSQHTLRQKSITTPEVDESRNINGKRSGTR